MAAPHGGERQDALKAHVCPASMPAAGGFPFFFFHHGLIITLSHYHLPLDTVASKALFNILISMNWTRKDNLKIVSIFTTLYAQHFA